MWYLIVLVSDHLSFYFIYKSYTDSDTVNMKVQATLSEKNTESHYDFELRHDLLYWKIRLT